MLRLPSMSVRWRLSPCVCAKCSAPCKKPPRQKPCGTESFEKTWHEVLRALWSYAPRVICQFIHILHADSDDQAALSLSAQLSVGFLLFSYSVTHPDLRLGLNPSLCFVSGCWSHTWSHPFPLGCSHLAVQSPTLSTFREAAGSWDIGPLLHHWAHQLSHSDLEVYGKQKTGLHLNTRNPKLVDRVKFCFLLFLFVDYVSLWCQKMQNIWIGIDLRVYFQKKMKSCRSCSLFWRQKTPP